MQRRASSGVRGFGCFGLRSGRLSIKPDTTACEKRKWAVFFPRISWSMFFRDPILRLRRFSETWCLHWYKWWRFALLFGWRERTRRVLQPNLSWIRRFPVRFNTIIHQNAESQAEAGHGRSVPFSLFSPRHAVESLSTGTEKRQQLQVQQPSSVWDIYIKKHSNNAKLKFFRPRKRRSGLLQAVRSAFRCPAGDVLRANGFCVNDAESASCGPSYRFVSATGQCRQVVTR